MQRPPNRSGKILKAVGSPSATQVWPARRSRTGCTARAYPDADRTGAEVPHRRLHDRLLGHRLQEWPQRMGIEQQGSAPPVTTVQGIRSVGPEGAKPKPSWVPEGGKPFLLVGSSLTAVFGAGVMALAIALAVSIQPTVDRGPARSRCRPSPVCAASGGAESPPAAPKTVPAPAPAAPPPAPAAPPPVVVPPVIPPRPIIQLPIPGLPDSAVAP